MPYKFGNQIKQEQGRIEAAYVSLVFAFLIYPFPGLLSFLTRFHLSGNHSNLDLV